MKLFLLILTTTCSLLAAEAKLHVTLSPAGSFVAKSSKVRGNVIYDAKTDSVQASNIKIPIKSFDTGMPLRNKHFAEHLKAKQHPKAILKKFVGKKGVGIGILSVAGKSQKVKIKYQLKGKNIIGKFKVATKGFGLKKVKYLGVGVEDIVTVEVEMPFKKKS